MPSTPDRNLHVAPEAPNSTAREQVTATLAQSQSPQEIIETLKLNEQYEARLEGLKFFGFTNPDGTPKQNDATLPSGESVINSFSPDELQVAGKYKEPVLVLIPKSSFSSMVVAMNDKRDELGLRNNVYYELSFKNSDSGSNVIKGWMAAIIEGTSQLVINSNDDVNQALSFRTKNNRQCRQPGERGVDRNKELMLLMELIRMGKNPEELSEMVVLDDDTECTHENAPLAFVIKNVGRITFVNVRPNYPKPLCRFRSSVGGSNVID